MQKKITIIFTLFLFSCDLIQDKSDQILARVNDDYIFNSDLKKVLPKNLSFEDSILFTNNFINNWAKRKLLFEKALINLDESEQNELFDLIDTYKNEIFSYAYQEKIVKSTMDTIINERSIVDYYDLNKSNFKLNQEIIKARYLILNNKNYNLKEVTNRFRSYKPKDLIFLDSISLQFNAFYFNDSTWINKDIFFSKFPKINDRLKQNITNNKLFYKFQDSLELYLIKIIEYKNKNDIAPFDFIKPTLKQVLINKKKLEFISKFEKEIIEDALQKKEFEIYENNL
ncbi:MAG: hypothetical protein ISP57_05750 [Flavobacteriaceae bacterium]|nr:hypothetical protein [Flavobacteriaceae bacterium]